MSCNATWFEIPTHDFERAIRFYEAVFCCPLERVNIAGGDLAIFPHDPSATGGALVAPDDSYQPSLKGAVIYLNAGADLQPLLDRVLTNGGRISVPKTALPEGMGFFAHFEDSEGNRVGLHSMG